MPSYETLVRDYHALVFHIARGVLRDTAAAEDCAQDVFLSFLERPEALDAAANVKAFVGRAARNRALDMAKAGRRRERREESVAGERRAAMDPVEAAFRSELRAKVAELPEDEREAVELHYLRGLTLPEASEVLSVPAGTLSSRINTALGRLRRALGAAAFAGLLATLESELALCEAGEAVPAGLSSKLMRLAPKRGAVPAKSSAGVVAGVTAFLVLVTVTGFMTWRAKDLQDPVDGVPVAGAPIDGPGSGGAAEVKDPKGVAEAAEVPPGEPAKVDVLLEGFLVRRDGRVIVREIGAWDHLPKQTMWDADAAEDELWRESLTISNADALGLPISEDGDFGAFLEGESELAPRSYVTLRIRGAVRPPSQFADDAARHEAFMNGLKPIAPTTVHAELVSSEVLSTEWLNAWREIIKHANTVGSSWTMEPGLTKRAVILEACTRLGEALDDARKARAGAATVEWRARREWEASYAIREQLKSMGLADAAPDVPSTTDLHGALAVAPSPEAFRTALVSRWGKDVLLLQTWVYRRVEEGHYSSMGLEVAEVCAMTTEEFDTLKRDLAAAVEEQRRSAETSGNAEVYREHLARVAATGLDVTDLTTLERSRFIIEDGVLVRSVAPDSAAAAAGILAGDILWRARVITRGKGPRIAEPCPIASPVNLGYLFECGEEHEMRSVVLDVVRDTGVHKLTLRIVK